MKTFSLEYLLILLALLLPVSASAQEPALPGDDEDLRAMVEAAGDRDSNEGAHVVAVLKQTRVRVEDTGLSHIEERQVLKCLSEQGAADLASLRLDYDPASNSIQVQSLRILRTDGTIEELSTEGVDLPQPQRAIYWGARMKIMPVPRLRPGDALEVRTYMKGFLIAYLGGDGAGAGASDDDERYIPPMRGHFYDIVSFHDRYPMKLRHYQVLLPRDKALQYEVHNGEVRSYVTFDEAHQSLSFWKRDVPAFKRAPHAEDPADALTKVVMATVPDWESKSRWFYDVNVDQFEPDDAIVAKVQEVVKGLRTDEERIRAITHWAANYIRYSGISMGAGEGYTLHPGTMVFENRSGVCKDKAGMAITMLRVAGYEVYPAMTMAGSRVERVPADQFNHCIAALKKPDGSWLLLDPTWVVYSPEIWSSAEGSQHFVIGTPEGEPLMITPAFRPEDNALTVKARTALDADGNLSGTITLTALGYAEQRLRREILQSRAATDRQAWFEEMIANLGPGARVEPVEVTAAELQDVTRPLSLDVRFQIPAYALVGEDGSLYFAPATARHLITTGWLAPYLAMTTDEERDQGLLNWAPRMRIVEETMTLPRGFQVERLPGEKALDGPVASLHSSAEMKGRRLRYSQSMAFGQRAIPPSDYRALKEVVQTAQELPEDVVILRRR